VRFENTGGTLPAPLQINKVYYIRNSDATSFQVSADLGGTSTVIFFGQGTGQSSVSNVKLGTVYQTIPVIEEHAGKQIVSNDLLLQRILRNKPAS